MTPYGKQRLLDLMEDGREHSLKQMVTATGLAHSTVWEHVSGMVDQGIATARKGKPQPNTTGPPPYYYQLVNPER